MHDVILNSKTLEQIMQNIVLSIIPYTAKLSSGKTFTVRVKISIRGKTFTVACL